MTSSSSAPVTSPRGQGHLQDFLTGSDKGQQTGSTAEAVLSYFLIFLFSIYSY